MGGAGEDRTALTEAEGADDLACRACLKRDVVADGGAARSGDGGAVARAERHEVIARAASARADRDLHGVARLKRDRGARDSVSRRVELVDAAVRHADLLVGDGGGCGALKRARDGDEAERVDGA